MKPMRWLRISLSVSSIQFADVDIAQDVAAGGGLIEAAKNVHQRAFAGAACAHDGVNSP